MPPLHPIRVAIVVASLRILGGQAVQAQRLIDNWRGDPAVEPFLVPVDPVPPRPFNRLLSIKYVRTITTQLCYWPLLVRELRRADLVHVFSASYTSFLLSPLPAVIVARLLRKPVLLNYHSGEAPDHLQRSAIARVVLRRLVDANVVPSTFLRDVFASFGIHADVVPNTIDLDAFTYRERRRTPGEGPRILSTRNLEPIYNVSCVLRAFAAIQRQYPSASLTLVGGGSEEARLRALADTLQLRNVTFAGRVAPADIPRYYAEADVYVQTPAIDNMPLSVLEAFASGLPVVSTRVGGVPSILEDGVHGRLAPPDDADAVAHCVMRMIARPDEARRMAAAARAACEAYDWRTVRSGWLAAYTSLTSPALPGQVHEPSATRAGAVVQTERP